MSSRNSRKFGRFCLSPIARSLKAMLCLGALTTQAQVVEPMLPVQPSAPEGFFPTLNDMSVLRGQDYPRSLTRGNFGEEGPDLKLQAATGLFPYFGPDENFYQNYDGFFRPIDNVLGVFTPQDAWTIENERANNLSMTLDGRLGALTRRFSPDQAHFKLGLLYFDVLWAGGGVIYSDYQGGRTFEGDNEDGWTGYMDVAVRSLMRLTDTIYLSAVADLIYLPFENEVALRFGNHNVPALFFRLNWAESYGPWDLMAYSEFRGVPGLDFYADADSPAFDRAGRYYFGFNRHRTNEFQSDEQAYFSNRLGFKANRLVFDEQWRLNIDVDHTDFWRTFDFLEHRTRDHVGVWLGYEGSVIPFAPRLSYDLFTMDGYESLWHRIETRLTGRLTENLHWTGMAGYKRTTGTRAERDNFIWEVGLDHHLTQNTRHWLYVGENFMNNEFLPETFTARYARYVIQQRFAKSLFLRAFAQFSDREVRNEELAVRDRWGLGASLIYNPLDFTSIRGTFMYESLERGEPLGDADRWLYRVEVQQQLGHRLTGRIFYQYEDSQGRSNDFREHMTGMSMRKYF